MGITATAIGLGVGAALIGGAAGAGTTYYIYQRRKQREREEFNRYQQSLLRDNYANNRRISARYHRIAWIIIINYL